MRALALILTLLTGFSGLVYEVAWQKILATLLGSHSEATAAVLAIFLGGLAVGYALFGRVTRRREERARSSGLPPQLLRLYGVIEIGIGAWALVFPWLFPAARMLSVRLPVGNEAFAFGFDVFLTILLIAPPTILMGGTIPILTQSLARSLEDATRVHAWVYAVNTLGAFFGALAGGFLLVPLLGLDGVLRAMAVINLVAGAVFFALGGRESLPVQESVAGDARPASFASYAAIVLLAGFAMMTVQTVLNRIGGLAFGASHFTFSMVVAVFVACIALGSFGVSALRRIPGSLIVASQWLLVVLLAGLYFLLPDAPYWVHVLRTVFSGQDVAFYPYFIAAFLALFSVLVIPIGLAGALLPLLFHHLRHEMDDLGGVAGKLYSWNTLGSLAGALLGGYALLFWLDLHEVFAVALAALILAAALITWRVGGVPLRVCATVAVAAMGGLVLLPDWQPERTTAGLFRTRKPIAGTYAGPRAFFEGRRSKLVFHTDDPIATITVAERKNSRGALSRTIVNNGKADGNMTLDYATMAIAGLLPALLTDDPSRSFVIGWGTGVTVGELGALEETEEVVVAEISPGVVEAARLFDYGNQRASKNPKVEVIRSDAYRALLRSEGRYGVIVSEPSNPWVAGVEMLFSKEFLSAARSRLTHAGVYAQWFHLYETDLATVETVLRTYAEVFDAIAVWYTFGYDILLLGFNDPSEVDLERIRARFERPDFSAGFERTKVDSLYELLAHEVLPLGVVNQVVLEGPIHTLRHPILSHRAARAFFRGESAELPRFAALDAARLGAERSLLRRASSPLEDGEREAVFAELVEHTRAMSRPIECATFLSAWMAAHPDSAKARAARERHAGWLVQATKSDAALPVRLQQLHQGKAPPMRGRPVEQAQRVTALFERYYHHALPFRRKAMDTAWRTCARSPAASARCTSGRRALERRLGPLSEEIVVERGKPGRPGA